MVVPDSLHYPHNQESKSYQIFSLFVQIIIFALQVGRRLEVYRNMETVSEDYYLHFPYLSNRGL